MQSTAELIGRKRDGKSLDPAEIAAFVGGIAEGSVSDAQIAAFAMAVWFRGLSVAEQSALTLAMRNSGRVLRWQGLDGPVLDKHSTGGVGDFVSLVLGPLIAAAGAYVPMISGRGLGHTGGTLDKLESIPGLQTALGPERFQAQVRETGVAIIGQTDDLAPADRRIYGVRDVTATVASVPLIVSSILSKKLAEGLDGLIMDIKVGNGAFMTSDEDARLLGEDICRVARESGVRCNAVVSDMGQPIAWSAGNALEVAEATAFLTGERRHPRMQELVLELASELLQLGTIEADRARARARVQDLLDTGAAAERFARMVTAQGGPADLLERPADRLPRARMKRIATAGRAGTVGRIDMHLLGLIVIQLGGGRHRAEDTIDPSVGLSDVCSPGTPVEPDTPVCVIHAQNEAALDRAALGVHRAVEIVPAGTEPIPGSVIRGRIEDDGA